MKLGVLLKWGEFLISGVISKGWPRKFCKRGRFYNGKRELKVLIKIKWNHQNSRGTVKVRSHTRCGSSNFAEHCNFIRNSPIFSNRHRWRERQHIMFSRLCKHHLSDLPDRHARRCASPSRLQSRRRSSTPSPPPPWSTFRRYNASPSCRRFHKSFLRP